MHAFIISKGVLPRSSFIETAVYHSGLGSVVKAKNLDDGRLTDSSLSRGNTLEDVGTVPESVTVLEPPEDVLVSEGACVPK